MAEISRFFDHIDGDRTYNAADWAEYFRQILTTGVLDSGSNLQVYVNGTDRIARVRPGKAWIEGYFYKLTEELELPLEEAHGTYDRIDRIVLRLNTNTDVRDIRLMVKTGEPDIEPTPPVLTREGNVYEISLAQILIIHNTTAIPVENVIDERLDSTVCGLANIALTYEEFALKQDTGDINDDTLPVELKGKPLVEQIMYVLEHAGKVKSVNGKTGEVILSASDVGAVPTSRRVNSKALTSNITIDVSDIPGLVSGRLALGQNASAAGAYAVALGRYASAVENASVALGINASATGNASVALGGTASTAGDSSVALGEGASAEGNNTVALGYNASAENASEGVLGGAGSIRTSKWIVPGSFTVSGTKNFEIPHPKPEKKTTHVIRHGAVESPTPGDTLYRWRIRATKDNDLVTIDLPDYFIYLNKDVQIFVTPQGHFGNGYGELNRETEQLQIYCQFAGEYNVLVIGTRNDDHQSVQDWDIKGVEREIGESWTGETYVFEVDEILEIEEIKEVS